jgi:outer membrane immunogenic protein
LVWHLRPRLGYLVNDQVLIYATGGLAYGQVKVSGATNVSGQFVGPSFAFPFSPAATAFSDSRTNVGWTAGAGIEGRFASWLPAGWTWKLEYLYVDLGSLDLTGPFPAANPTGNALGGYNALHWQHHHPHPFHRQHRARRAELQIRQLILGRHPHDAVS